MTAIDHPVIGLDLSITSTGVALPSGQTLRVITSIRDRDMRLVYLRNAVAYYLRHQNPRLAVIEEVPFTPRSKRAAEALYMVHGVIRAELAERQIPFVYVSTTFLKWYATGSGSAIKEDVVVAAKELDADVTDDNEADAWWLRAIGLHHFGEPVSVKHALLIDSLTKLKWPMP